MLLEEGLSSFMHHLSTLHPAELFWHAVDGCPIHGELMTLMCLAPQKQRYRVGKDLLFKDSNVQFLKISQVAICKTPVEKTPS